MKRRELFDAALELSNDAFKNGDVSAIVSKDVPYNSFTLPAGTYVVHHMNPWGVTLEETMGMGHRLIVNASSISALQVLL